MADSTAPVVGQWYQLHTQSGQWLNVYGSNYAIRNPLCFASVPHKFRLAMVAEDIYWLISEDPRMFVGRYQGALPHLNDQVCLTEAGNQDQYWRLKPLKGAYQLLYPQSDLGIAVGAPGANHFQCLIGDAPVRLEFKPAPL